MNDFESHLTDDQFAECALGLGGSGEASAHLAGCGQCRDELARFGTTMDEFSNAALGWSEARSPLSLQQHTRTRAEVRRPWFVTASWAMAAGVVLAVGGSMLTHRTAETGPEASVARVAESDADTEIARDNELMRNVDMAINEGVASPESEYSLDAVERRQSRAAVESRVQ